MSSARKAFLGALGLLGTGGVGLAVALEQSVQATDLIAHSPKFKWPHTGILSTFDHASVRRGYEVYKNVCAACHSMQFVCYRNLVNVSHSEEEAKAEAAEIMVTDGPDDVGEMFQRPGKLSDHFPSPYPNEQAARAVNNGAYPPDLSLITLARHGGEDYVFALLTGYYDAPAGIQMREGLYYNPYFPGGSIAMAKALYNETIEYSDGTPATASQLAKDVSCFLKWCSEPEHDERKRMCIKFVMVWAALFSFVFYLHRHKWSAAKSMRIEFHPKKTPKK